jgi:hypothetical protein
MRKVVFSCLLGMFVFAMMAGAGLAHPPSELVLSYNRTDGMLTVNAPHSVPDGKRHYIEKFTVSVDGGKYYELEAEFQIDNRVSTAVFHMGELKAGAVVEVYAKCNRAGDLKKSLTVE